jgi:hypothetical protein
MMPAAMTTPARMLNQGFGRWPMSGEDFELGMTASAWVAMSALGAG